MKDVFTVDLNFDPYNILAGFIFGMIGWGAFRFGRQLDRWKPVTIGLALMIYPYFFSNAWLLWGTGIALVITLGFHHDV